MESAAEQSDASVSLVQVRKSNQPVNDIGPVDVEKGPPQKPPPVPEVEKKAVEGAGARLCNYLLLLWDGIGFFKYKFHEIPRTKGESLSWCDKCKSVKWVLMTLLIICVFFIVIENEGSKNGQLKSESTMIIPSHEFNFTISNAFPLHMIETFDIEDLLGRIETMQTRKTFKNSLVSEHYRTIPQNYFLLTDDDKLWLEEFLCANSQIQIMQSEDIAATLVLPAYRETVSFFFKCELLNFADSNFYVHHYIDEDVTGYKSDSRFPVKIEESGAQISLKNTPGSSTLLNHTHWQDLANAINSISLYHTRTNETIDLSSDEKLDEFKTNSNTTHILRTEVYSIQKATFENATIAV